MEYQNQKATIKPDEIFIRCSEQGKFRVRVDISHLACCLTTFHKPTLTFRKLNENGRIIQSENPQSEKKIYRSSFEGCHLNGDTVKSRLPDILVTTFLSPGSTGLWAKGSQVYAEGREGEEDIKRILVSPHHKAFGPRWLMCLSIEKFLLLRTRGNLSKLEEKGVFPCENLALETLLMTYALSQKTMKCSVC